MAGLRLQRTRECVEVALRRADCPLFEAIVRWVLQDHNYSSVATLCERIRELEKLEREAGRIPPVIRTGRYFKVD